MTQELFQDEAPMQLTGPIRFAHQWIDMSKRQVNNCVNTWRFCPRFCRIVRFCRLDSIILML